MSFVSWRISLQFILAVIPSSWTSVLLIVDVFIGVVESQFSFYETIIIVLFKIKLVWVRLITTHRKIMAGLTDTASCTISLGGSIINLLIEAWSLLDELIDCLLEARYILE